MDDHIVAADADGHQTTLGFLIIPSSIEYTTNREYYAVDDIVVRPTTCSLVVSYGITNVRTIQVTIGLAIPSRIYNH